MSDMSDFGRDTTIVDMRQDVFFIILTTNIQPTDLLIFFHGSSLGLRNDRQANKRSGGELDSWVSPLCKKLKVQDLLQSLHGMFPDDSSFSSWLLKAEAEEAGPSKRPRTESSKPDVGRRLWAEYPSYAWLKEVLTSDEYREARKPGVA